MALQLCRVSVENWTHVHVRTTTRIVGNNRFERRAGQLICRKVVPGGYGLVLHDEPGATVTCPICDTRIQAQGLAAEYLKILK